MRTTYTYNEGINFLRAVSILGIVLYHIFPFAMKGGFLGVCFFFLISGYLAAKKGQIDWDNESFHIRKYYQKRATHISGTLYHGHGGHCLFYRLSSGIIIRGKRGSGKYLSGLQQLVADADAGILLYEDHGTLAIYPPVVSGGGNGTPGRMATSLFTL